MAKKVKKVVVEEENLRPDDFPKPPLSKDNAGKGPLETLSPTNTIITGMVVILIGVVAMGTPWLFFNGASVPTFVSVGALTALLGGFLIAVGMMKETWRKAVKEWLKTPHGQTLSDLKLPEWLEIEETKSAIPVLPPDGIIPASSRIHLPTSSPADEMELPDLSEMEAMGATTTTLQEDVEEDPQALFKDEPAPDFDQFLEDDDDEELKDLVPHLEQTAEAPWESHSETEELPDLVASPVAASPTAPAADEQKADRDFLDGFLNDEPANQHSQMVATLQEKPAAIRIGEVREGEMLPPPTPPGATRLEAGDGCKTCGHQREDHSPTKGICAACMMSDDDNVCEAYAE